MRIICDSQDGGCPFEIYTSEDHQLDVEPGWYYSQLAVPEDGGYEALDADGTGIGPFRSLVDAFIDAINCSMAPANKSATDPSMW